MSKRLLIGALLSFSFGLAFSQTNKLVIDTDEFHYDAIFDSKRISAGRLRELLLFSPYEFGTEGWLVADHKILAMRDERPGRIKKGAIADPLELCIDNDSHYRPCGTRDILDPNFFANADVNVARNQEALTGLEQAVVPSELTSVVQQFRDSLMFFSTVEKRRLEYLRNGDLRILSMPIGAIDPSENCVAAIKKLEGVMSISQRYELSHYSWQNCVVSAWDEMAPTYPQQEWRRFLQAYGITEHFTNKAID